MSATPQKTPRGRGGCSPPPPGWPPSARCVAAMPGRRRRTQAAHGHGTQQAGRTVDVQLLSFNDLHGNLEPPAGSAGTVTETQADGTTKAIHAGGVEYLATLLRQARKGNPYSVTAAGRRHGRRQPAALRALPRRAHHRGAEQARPRRDRPSATTSSTRAPTSWPACRTAAATRPTAATRRARSSRAPTSPTSPPTSPTRRPASRSSSRTASGRRTASRSASSA